VYGIACCKMPGRPCSRHERTPIVDFGPCVGWEWDLGVVFMGFGDILCEVIYWLLGQFLFSVLGFYVYAGVFVRCGSVCNNVRGWLV
jgi:hypothetical protein